MTQNHNTWAKKDELDPPNEVAKETEWLPDPNRKQETEKDADQLEHHCHLKFLCGATIFFRAMSSRESYSLK